MNEDFSGPQYGRRAVQSNTAKQYQYNSENKDEESSKTAEVTRTDNAWMSGSTQNEVGNAPVPSSSIPSSSTMTQITNASVPHRNRHFDDDDDNQNAVEMVADLDEEPDQDITTKTAQAPRNAHRKVQSLQELEDEPTARLRAGIGAVSSMVGPSNSDDIDLSILSAMLAPQEVLNEPDEEWDFNRLLQQMAQELQADHEQRILDGIVSDSDTTVMTSKNPSFTVGGETTSKTLGGATARGARVATKK